VFGQLCNFSFEPRNLSFGLSEVLLHLIYWSAHNFAQTYCCLGTSTMIQGGPRKTSSRSLVDVGIQRDVILMSGILEIFLSESPYPSNSLQLRHTFAAVRKISNGQKLQSIQSLLYPVSKTAFGDGTVRNERP
jgi:hypothetical protein